MTAFAEASDLATYFDERIISDLVSDTGVPDQAWRVNAKVTAFLATASGRIVAACTVANHYLDADLLAMTGNSQSLLKWLTCTLVMASLVARRQGRYREEYKEKLEEAEQYLDRLRKGERLFGLNDEANAGATSIEGPTTATYDKLNLLVDRGHYYPLRSRRMPNGTIGD